MEKPWDKLRSPTKPPIGSGSWYTTSNVQSSVNVEILRRITATIKINNQAFDSGGLRQLAEFCTELADQLGGK